MKKKSVLFGVVLISLVSSLFYGCGSKNVDNQSSTNLDTNVSNEVQKEVEEVALDGSVNSIEVKEYYNGLLYNYDDVIESGTQWRADTVYEYDSTTGLYNKIFEGKLGYHNHEGRIDDIFYKTDDYEAVLNSVINLDDAVYLGSSEIESCVGGIEELIDCITAY